MAGVGFELKKLFRDNNGLLGSVKAYAFSSFTTIGPMVLCMTMIIGMQWLMSSSGSSFAERELFLATTVYCFIFSVLVTGGLSMVLTRFIADMIFLKQYGHLLSSFYGSLCICLPAGAVSAWLFLHDLPVGPGYKAVTYIFFAELIVIWLVTVQLSALKDYNRIVGSFFTGVSIAVIGSWLITRYTPYNGAAAVLTMIDIGFFVTIFLTIRHFEQKFPPKDSRIYLEFLGYFRKYPSLFFIGTFFYSGVYIHSFIYWLGPENATVAEKYFISPFYDLPVFYAYLTVVPTLVTFVVSVETSFYEKFRGYYSKILNEGTLPDIERAKREMQQTLIHEISFIMEVQLLFTVVSIALGIKLLPALGFSMEQLHTFNILALGYFLFIIAFIVMLLMLYYDDRKGVITISGLFVLINAGLSYWTMQNEYHGLGMFLASFITLVLALSRLMIYVRNIDYYTFCSQPIVVRRKQPFWQRWRKKPVAAAVLLMLAPLVLSACDQQQAPTQQVAESTPAAAAAPGSNSSLAEDKKLYERDNDTSVIPLYLTILPDKSGEKDAPVTWYALNRIRTQMEEGDMKVIVQEGAADGSGPQAGMFGYSSTDANAKISLRGNTSRYAAQRSYKVKLNDQAGLWRDQRVLNLNKSPFDPSRIRNKLSFDIFETIPNITSLRTQYVHLFVKDLSDGSPKGKPFEDYGLYLDIEQPNEMFLKNHWLDPYGQLYKAIMFEFFRYPDMIKSESDPAYSKEAFESVLEIQGREEHEKLITMLNDVNNLSIPIDEVIEKHFDLDNYLTWMAANILMDNMDTNTQNFLLYSPLNSNKWYFLPWDYDGGWELSRSVNRSSDYSKGISNYWGSVLHNRFFRSQKNVQKLKDKIDTLYEKINNDTVAQMVERYRSVVDPYIHRAPDINFLPVTTDKLDDDYKHIAETPLRSIERFNEDLETPRPFFLDDPKSESGKTVFRWDLSFDLQSDNLVYDWTLAKDPAFTRIIDSRKSLTGTKLEINPLAAGIYYWKVVVRDERGHQQVAFDGYTDEDGNNYYGIRQLKVE